ncbi:putative cytochrome c heme lyase [Peziza echinospora]|nr:putative cytochrome c heme lyase [Peziza echinospora]
MGWFWADPAPAPTNPHLTNKRAVTPGAPISSTPPPAECPMHKPAAPPAAVAGSPPPGCPMHEAGTGGDHGSSAPYKTSLNPLNYMPDLPSARATHTDQSAPLPTGREVSSIPKATGEKWEYPSPQQMYNAMRNKGYVESEPGEIMSIVNMVAVHNFLNEGAWGEILGWEREFAGGVARAAARRYRTGGQLDADLLVEEELKENLAEIPEPKLLRFQGRSQDRTPKSRILELMGTIYPSKFAGPPPFDRHDWYVVRPKVGKKAEGDGKEGKEEEQEVVRYVIDYYAGEPEPTGEPVFYLDVRPALDRPSAVAERAIRWGGEIWYKASGGWARERARWEKEKAERSTR